VLKTGRPSAPKNVQTSLLWKGMAGCTSAKCYNKNLKIYYGDLVVDPIT
jgi:hypothetical protein